MIAVDQLVPCYHHEICTVFVRSDSNDFSFGQGPTEHPRLRIKPDVVTAEPAASSEPNSMTNEAVIGSKMSVSPFSEFQRDGLGKASMIPSDKSSSAVLA